MAKRLRLSMVGREKEFERFQSLLSQAISGHGSTIFIQGEVGIGKTRLVEEMGRFCEITGSRMLIGHCLPGAPAPYLPFLEAIRSAGKKGEDLCKDLCGFPPDKVMFDVLEWLRKMSEASPIVLVLEDIHWSDTGTTQLMHFLTRNIGDSRILLVGTFRPEELIGEEGASHPLTEVLRVLRREGNCYEVQLNELKTEEVEELINLMLSGRTHHSFVDQVMKGTEGNPLFVIEMVSLLQQSQELERQDGFWSAKGQHASDVPPTIREVVMRRVDRLTKSRRRLLDCAAVTGMRFDIDTLADILGHTRLEVIEALEELENPHFLVQPLQEELFTFNHEAVMKAIYENISVIKRKELHRMLAARLEKKKVGVQESSALAHHLEMAGDAERALPFELIAGEEWLKCQGVFEAIPYFQKVLEQTKVRPELLTDRLRALEGLADCFYSQAEFQRADDLLKEHIELSGQSSVCARILRKRAECWGPTRLGQGSSDHFLLLLDQAEQCPLINDFERGELSSARALYHLWQGDFYSANHYSRLAEEWFEKSGDRERYLGQLLHHIYIYLSLGDIERAYGNIGRAKLVQSQVGGKVGEADISCVLGELLLQQGKYQEALATFSRGRELTSQLGDHISMCWCQIYSTFAHYLLGEMGEASTAGDRAVQFAEEGEIPYTVVMALGLRALVYCQASELQTASADLDRAESLMAKLRSAVRVQAPGLVKGVRARLYTSTDDRSRAEESYVQSLSLLQGSMTSLLCEGLVHTWYGEGLQRWGRLQDSIGQYEMARGIFILLGNKVEEAKVSRSLRLLTAPEKDMAVAK